MDFNMLQATLKKHFFIRVLVIALFLYAWVSVNIYLPALPQLVTYFHASSHALKLSIVLFLGGYAFSQLIWGPLSEKHGRRKMLIAGISITTLGVLITMLSLNVVMFNMGRLIEALGLGCASVLGRAILVDTLDSTELLKTMSSATIAVNLMPAIAPILGGNLLYIAGWRSIFLFLLIYSIILLFFFVSRLPETHQHIKKELQASEMLMHYRELIKNRRFMGYVLIYMFGVGAMIGYYALAPFLFIQTLHISAHVYGYLGLITVATYLLGALVCRLVAPKWGIDKTIFLSVTILLLAAAFIIVISLFYTISVFSVLIPMSIYTFSAGILSPNANTGAMNESAYHSGAGGAILMFCLYGGASLFSSIATSLPLTSLMPLGIYIATVAVCAFSAFWIFLYKASA